MKGNSIVGWMCVGMAALHIGLIGYGIPLFVLNHNISSQMVALFIMWTMLNLASVLGWMGLRNELKA